MGRFAVNFKISQHVTIRSLYFAHNLLFLITYNDCAFSALHNFRSLQVRGFWNNREPLNLEPEYL